MHPRYEARSPTHDAGASERCCAQKYSNIDFEILLSSSGNQRLGKEHRAAPSG